MNPNNITSKYYNLVSSPLKGTDVTDEEIGLINRLVPNGSNILDVGAGTGRHSLILSKLGFNVTAIDSSRSMLSELKVKDDKKLINVINKNIYKFNTTDKFDLITLFWNSFNEIALTKNNALLLLKNLKRLLKPNGQILINIDDSSSIDPAAFNFETIKIDGELKYKMKWTTSKYFAKTNTSVSREEVEIYKGDKLIDSRVTFIKQRYWSFSEIELLCQICNLKVENYSLKTSNELYLVLTTLSK